MDEKKVLLKMVKALLVDLQTISMRGAGYYICAPFVDRYNSLLLTAKRLFGEDLPLLQTFKELSDAPSTDPADKERTTQRVVIELGQLIAFLEAALEQEKAPAPTAETKQTSAT